MAIVMLLTWRGVTKEQYEQARQRVGWERDVPQGGVFHVAWFTAEGLHVVDVCETVEDFRRFADERLMPVAKGELGFEGEPEVTFHEAHAVFIPALARP
jgi:hypothetical protein